VLQICTHDKDKFADMLDLLRRFQWVEKLWAAS